MRCRATILPLALPQLRGKFPSAHNDFLLMKPNAVRRSMICVLISSCSMAKAAQTWFI